MESLIDFEEIMTTNKTAWYMSSQDPQALSLTIKGMLGMYIPAVLLLATYFHLPLTETAVVELITVISAIIPIIMLIIGSLRKFKNWIKK